MSEADSTPRRRPPTIDLKAQEVDSGATEQAKDSTAEPGIAGATASALPLGRAAPYAAGVVLGALAVLAAGVGLWLGGVVTFHHAAAPGSAPPAAAARSAGDGQLSARLDRIEQALQAPRSDSVPAARLTELEGQSKALGASLDALTRRVDAVAAATQSAQGLAQTAATAADAAERAAEAGVSHGDLDALSSRVAVLEDAIKSLSSNVAQRTSSAVTDDRVTRLTIAAEALRAAVERGAPYQAELAAVTALGADRKQTEILTPFAATGLPNAAALGHELAALSPALDRAAEPKSADASFLARLESHARKLVRITPLDTTAAPAGDDASALVGRISAAAERGDIAAALADIAKLPEPARALADGWVRTAQAREAALAASRQIAASALTALGRPVSQ